MGIFPEGGSHDRTTLLPLKAGACAFIWGAKEQFNKSPKLVCCGINYFGAHKFRSKVVINFSSSLSYKLDKKRF